jgi:DNA-directed RNA polymerase specialized sigma24 family protein
MSALQGLGPEQRQVLTLYYLDDLSVGDIARKVGCPPGTVKSRLFHARRQVRHALMTHAPSREEPPFTRAADSDGRERPDDS